MTCGNHCFQIRGFRAAAGNGGCGLVKLVCKNVCQCGIFAAACICKFCGSVCIFAVEDVKDCGIFFRCLVSGSCEVFGCFVIVAFPEGYYTHCVLPVGVFFNLGKFALGICKVVVVDVNDCKVVLGTCAVEFLDGFLVDLSLGCVVFYDGSSTEESLFVKDVDVLVDKGYEFVVRVVLPLQESCRLRTCS